MGDEAGAPMIVVLEGVRAQYGLLTTQDMFASNAHSKNWIAGIVTILLETSEA